MSRGLMITLIGAVLVLALGVAGIGYYVFMKPADPGAAQVEPENKSKESAKPDPAVMELTRFVTDLADKDRMRYIDATFVLGLKEEGSLETVAKFEPQIRDTILSKLRTFTSADLAGAPGKQRLAADLKESLAPIIEEYLTAVYVTDLVIQ